MGGLIKQIFQTRQRSYCTKSFSSVFCPDLVRVTWLLRDAITEPVEVDAFVSSGSLCKKWWLLEGYVA